MNIDASTVLRKSFVADRLTFVWLFLMVATALSWLLGHGSVTGDNVATAGVIAVAFVKVRMIGLDFMELRTAHPGLRMAFEGWLLLTGAVLIIMSAI